MSDPPLVLVCRLFQHIMFDEGSCQEHRSIMDSGLPKYGLAAFFMQKLEGIFMAAKNKIVNIKVFFDDDQDASQGFLKN